MSTEKLKDYDVFGNDGADEPRSLPLYLVTVNGTTYVTDRYCMVRADLVELTVAKDDLIDSTYRINVEWDAPTVEPGPSTAPLGPAYMHYLDAAGISIREGDSARERQHLYRNGEHIGWLMPMRFSDGSPDGGVTLSDLTAIRAEATSVAKVCAFHYDTAGKIVRERKETAVTTCDAGQKTEPRECDRHSAHYWCDTCAGFYGVPHTGIHEGRSAHPYGTSLTDQCACRPCKVASGRARDADLAWAGKAWAEWSHETHASIDVHGVAAREDLPDVLAQTVDRLGLTNVETGPVTRYPAKPGPDGYDEFWAANAYGRDDKGMRVTVTVYYSPTPMAEEVP